MAFLIWLRSTWAGRAVGAVVAALALLWAAYVAGRRDARQRAAQKAAEDYRETRGRIDEADLGAGATDDERIRRLRDFADGK